MAVIMISRQYGSGGDEIARQLCELLAYGYFDKFELEAAPRLIVNALDHLSTNPSGE